MPPTAFEFSQKLLSVLVLYKASLNSVQQDGPSLCFEEFVPEDNQLSWVLDFVLVGVVFCLFFFPFKVASKVFLPGIC